MAKKEIIKESVVAAPKKNDLFAKMRKSILKKNEDAMLDLAEPTIWATSGNYVLNHILSGKFSRGYPSGRITQIFGDSGSGKSFLMAKAIAEAQKEGYMVAVLDSEQAVSQDYLRKIGVDLDPSMLMTVQVQTVEQTQDLLIEVLNGVKEEQDKLGNVSDLKLMLIVDSIGMLSSGKAAQNAEDGHHAADMGTKAKALTNMFNQVVQKVGVTETVCLITNHGAMEVGVMFPQMKPKGGQSLEFVPSISLRVTKGKIKPADLAELEYLYKDGIPKHLGALGIVSRIELYKSRFTRPFRKVQLMIPYDFGLPEFAGLFDYLKDNNIIIEGGRKGYYNCTEVEFEKDFSRKDFIKGGWADIIIKHLLSQEEKGHMYDFIMKSQEDIDREKSENQEDDFDEEIDTVEELEVYEEI